MEVKTGPVERYCANCDAPCNKDLLAIEITTFADTLPAEPATPQYVRIVFALCGYCRAQLNAKY